jgi:hypothetical protein
MADFRPTFKKANPDSKGVKEVAVACGAAWGKMSDKDKEKYNAAAAKAKEDKAAAAKAAAATATSPRSQLRW